VANVVVLIVVLVMVVTFLVTLSRHGGSIIAKRGMSIGADLGTLSDAPRVRIRSVTKKGPGRVRLVLMPDAGPDDGGGMVTKSDLDFMVGLEDEDFGFGLLNDWQRTETPLAVVIPPGSRLVRLRSLGDLQHLTLRRIDEA
jgi:hypothetical protein